MKKGKIILSTVAILATVGTAFAFNSASKRFVGEPVYHANGSWTGCYINTPLNCGTTKSLSGDYYTVDGVKNTLPADVQLKRLQ